MFFSIGSRLQQISCFFLLGWGCCRCFFDWIEAAAGIGIFLLDWGCSRCFFRLDRGCNRYCVFFCWIGAAADVFFSIGSRLQQISRFFSVGLGLQQMFFFDWIEAAANIVFFFRIGAAADVFFRLDRGCSKYLFFLLDWGLQQMFFFDWIE